MSDLNEQAVEAAARYWSFQSHLNPTTDMRHSIAAYFDSLAEQGIVLVEQPSKPCEDCDGDGRSRTHGYRKDAPREACGGEIEFRVRLADMQHGVIPAGVMSLPGLARVYLERPEARLVFATAVGCGPVDPVFIRSEIERMGARVLACVHNGPCPAAARPAARLTVAARLTASSPTSGGAPPATAQAPCPSKGRHDTDRLRPNGRDLRRSRQGRERGPQESRH